MHIEFEKVIAQNFLSIGNTPLEWNIKDTGKTLILGKNGAGKSSILASLTFGLFGKAYSKANKSSIVNSINGKGCLVEVYFSIGDIKYKVIRGMKPSIFEIYINDELITQTAATKDYQLVLEDIIKMDFKTYSQVVMLGSMSYVPFLQLDAKERRAFVENILDIESFTKMNKTLKNIITQNKNDIFEATTNLGAVESGIDLLNGVIENLEKDNSDKLKALEEEIKVIYSNYKDVEEKIQLLEDSIKKTLVDDAKIQDIRDKISKCNTLISTKESECSRLRRQIGFFDKNPQCPECGQNITDEHKEKHLTTYNTELTDAGEAISKARNIKGQLETSLTILIDLQKSKNNQESQLRTLTEKLAWLKSDLTKKYTSKKQLESVDSNSLIRGKKQELEDKELERKELKDILQNHLQRKELLDIIAVSLKDSGAKAEIIKNYVPIICRSVNKYLDIMNLYVKFNLDEEFNETLKNRHRDDYQYESFSMGERFRINTAMLFAWLEIIKIRKGISTNLLVIDEILEILDYNGVEEFIGIVSDIPKLNLFAITHKVDVEMLFDNVLYVTKVKDFTQLRNEPE